MVEEFQIGDDVKVSLNSELEDAKNWFKGKVFKIDPYSNHRHFYWIELDPAAEEILGIKVISVLNPKNIQRL
jgi:hypothetical protein